MKLSLLAFGAHPDDIELGAGGTIAKHIAAGFKAGLVDLTLGEMGTRGTVEGRRNEAKEAGRILGAECRYNLELADGFLRADKESLKKVVQVIRFHQPDIVICNAITDRHPDHGRGSNLVSEACFLAGLAKWETDFKGQEQKAWRPQAVYHYIQFQEIKPDLIVDISGFEEIKLKSVLAHSSQFYDPNSDEAETVISSKGFLESVDYRAKNYGRQIGVEYGEAFTVERMIGTSFLTQLI